MSPRRGYQAPEKIHFKDPFSTSSSQHQQDKDQYLDIRSPAPPPHDLDGPSPLQTPLQYSLDQRSNRFERLWRRRSSAPRSTPAYDFILFDDPTGAEGRDSGDYSDLETNVSMQNILSSPAARCALYPRLSVIESTACCHPSNRLSTTDSILSQKLAPHRYTYARRRSSLPECIFKLSLSNNSNGNISKKYIGSPLEPSSRKPSVLSGSGILPMRPTTAATAIDMNVRRRRESTDWHIDPFADYKMSDAVAAPHRPSVSRLSISRFIEPETTKGEAGMEAFCNYQSGADAYPLRLYRSMIFEDYVMVEEYSEDEEEGGAKMKNDVEHLSEGRRSSMMLMDTASCQINV